MKNTHVGVLPLVKYGEFSCFLNCTNGTLLGKVSRISLVTKTQNQVIVISLRNSKLLIGLLIIAGCAS